jgi:purine-nucleoside phosphorylase
MSTTTHIPDNDNRLISGFDTLLVPQGMEYKAVCQGIGKNKQKIKIISIPVGIKPVSNFLQQWQQQPEFLDKLPKGLILMGLGGSLSPNYSVGDVILYRDCGLMEYSQESAGQCDHFLTNWVFQELGNTTFLGRGITSDRVISSAQEKLLLGARYQADVVDMEGIALLNWSRQWDIPVAMIRIISDNCQQDLPDLTDAFRADGSLQPLILARQMLKNPSNSIHLIRSSLKSLEVLKEVASKLIVDR